MGVVKRSDLIEGMKKNAYEYGLEQREYEQEKSVVPLICDIKTTNAAWEQSTTVISSSDLEQFNEGEEIPSTGLKEGYTTYCGIKKFGKKLAATREVSKDIQRLEHWVEDITKQFMVDAQRTKDKFVAKHFNYGGYTSGHSIFNQTLENGLFTDPSGDYIYDGKPFFNLSGNTRSSKGGGTYYNGVALDLNDANFRTLWQLITRTNAYNEDDTEVAITPDIILVPTGEMKFKADEVLKSSKNPYSAENRINPIQDLVKPISWRYLSDTDAWFIGCAKKGLIFYQSEEPEIDFWYDHKHQVYYYSIVERYGLMIKNWRFWAGSNFSTS